jgi:hypothetical protein
MLSFSMFCNLLQAAAEGATLGVVFLAVDLLSKPAGQTLEWSSKGFLGSVPQLAAGLNAMPRNQLFLLLLGLAVLLPQPGDLRGGLTTPQQHLRHDCNIPGRP